VYIGERGGVGDVFVFLLKKRKKKAMAEMLIFLSQA
jgi:hypothetical protein